MRVARGKEPIASTPGAGRAGAGCVPVNLRLCLAEDELVQPLPTRAAVAVRIRFRGWTVVDDVVSVEDVVAVPRRERVAAEVTDDEIVAVVAAHGVVRVPGTPARTSVASTPRTTAAALTLTFPPLPCLTLFARNLYGRA